LAIADKPSRRLASTSVTIDGDSVTVFLETLCDRALIQTWCEVIGTLRIGTQHSENADSLLVFLGERAYSRRSADVGVGMKIGEARPSSASRSKLSNGINPEYGVTSP